ncbi:protein farnesyltransferase subunit beta-like isoform X1 [Musa acuminata AAA Group]|uniref:protein farnesyltransferase subunit beta-like isoform X1 n=1 Tax=Musa acuminata AAA Group TaxID=214697 RepID=UPI0031CE19D9
MSEVAGGSLPRSDSSVAMESSPPSSSTSSPPPSPSDGPRRLTVTQLEQLKVEEEVFEIYRILRGIAPHTQSFMLELWRDTHIEFLTRGLGLLGPSYHVLDANRPWLCYWIIHSIALLGEPLHSELEDSVVEFLSHCEDKYGGYGGGPGQMPHLATTYAAVNTLVTLGSDMALSSINRANLLKFLLRMKDSSGAFRMHDGGEIDVRACYTAISVASILNVLDVELVKDLGNYILSCQTYEGGIAGEPGSEAHGGYTFCGLAAMILINEADRLDLPSLVDWVASRQGVECGFQGRVNKLVDGCYSFWQGGALVLAQRLSPILHKQLESSFISRVQASVACNKSCNFTTGETGLDGNLCGAGTSHAKIEGGLSDFGFSFIEKQTECGPLFQSIALQQYILLCSQVLEGGFKDKPGKQRDFYHSCYCLSGLSVSQYSCSKDASVPPPTRAVLGPYANLLEPVHPLYNVVLNKYYKSHEFFSCL